MAGPFKIPFGGPSIPAVKKVTVAHDLATAEHDFLTGKSGGGEWIKKTLAETKDILGIINPLVYMGTIDCAGNPDYPAATKGHVYFVSVAGKIGGASGVEVDVDDKLVCNTDTVAGDHATVGSKWNIVQGNLIYETDAAEIKMAGTAAVGAGSKVPRSDHVHPSDTVKADKIAPATAKNLAGLVETTGQLEDSLITPAVGTDGFTLAGGTTNSKTLTVDETKSISDKVDKVQTEASTATAATVALGTSALRHLLTGTTTVTGFTGTAGVMYHCRADGAFLLTHHSTNLIITQTGASITTAAGDTFDVIMITGTTARVVNFIRASGMATQAADAVAITGGTGDFDELSIGGADLPATLNRKASEQAVVTTFANSGSSGIRVADNANINFGTGDFTLVWEGSLPDWTPGAQLELMHKYATSAGRLTFGLDANNRILLRPGEASRSSTVAPAVSDGNNHLICASFINGVSVTFYVDGVQLGGVVAETAVRNPNDAATFFISGTDVARAAAQTQFAATFNRALTAAEVLDLYVNGVAEADKWGSQVPFYESDFSAGLDGWSINVDDETSAWVHDVDKGVLSVTVAGTNASRPRISRAGSYYDADVYHKVEIDYNVTSGNCILDSWALGAPAYTVNETLTGEGTLSFEGLPTVVGGGTLFLMFDGRNTFEVEIKAIRIYRIGATLALEPSGIQPAPGQWLDSTTNKLHATQPAAGSSLKLTQKDFEYRWTNTWTASSAAQYIGGFNQNVLPLNAWIDEVIATVAGTPVAIQVGDGSDVDRFVETVTPIVGANSLALASRTHDGTNRKLVVTPGASFTGSISWTIRGKILEA